MTNDELKKRTEEVLKEANKAVLEAQKALQRTENYFIENDLSTEKLKNYLADQYEPIDLEEFDGMVERIMEEVRLEAERSIEQEKVKSTSSITKKRFKGLI
jgi:hypothetical protein